MISSAEFRRTLGHFATGVTIITTCDEQSQPKGFTANAFTSLSLTPPMVLVCVDKNSQTHPTLDSDGAVFTVNILTQDQEALSRVFASKSTNKFDGIDYTIGETGAPILADVLAFLECRVVERLSSGDHTIIVGEVHNLGAIPHAEPLLYYRGGYSAMAVSASSSMAAAASTPHIVPSSDHAALPVPTSLPAGIAALADYAPRTRALSRTAP